MLILVTLFAEKTLSTLNNFYGTFHKMFSPQRGIC